MLTKQDLGIGYLTGFGLGLSVVLVMRFLLVTPGESLVTIAGTVSGLLLSVGLVYAGYWFLQSELDDDAIWTISKWGGLGITVLTVLSLVVIPFLYTISASGLNLLVSNIAAGGVIGVLVGGVSQLRKEHDRIRTLNQRNVVLNRVLRHNIRNEMGMIVGWADILEHEVDGRAERNARRIRKKAEDVSALGDKARRIEEAIDHETDKRPVEAVSCIERQVETLREAYPDARIETALPGDAWVRADEFFASVVENLLRNAVEHTGGEPTVRVSLDRIGDRIRLRIEDDGPGIPERERDVLIDGGQTPVYHGTGMGLWLVKWLVEGYDGELAFDETEHGSAVVVTLHRTAPPSSDGTAAAPSPSGTTADPVDRDPTP